MTIKNFTGSDNILHHCKDTPLLVDTRVYEPVLTSRMLQGAV